MLNSAMIDLLGVSLWETLYMVVISTILSYAVGLPIGVVLNITGKDGICRNRVINSILGVIVNIFRSIPFLILLIWMIPVTQAIVGTMVGPTSVIVPLVASAAPFVGRMVESSLSEIDGGVGLGNIAEVSAAGVDIAVAGSAVYGAEDVGQRVKELVARMG